MVFFDVLKRVFIDLVALILLAAGFIMLIFPHLPYYSYPVGIVLILFGLAVLLRRKGMTVPKQK